MGLLVEKIIQVFSEKNLRAGIRINNKLKKFGKSWDDVEEYLKREVVVPRPIGKLCPDCGSLMQLKEEGKDFCHWTCKKCRLGIPVNQSAEKELSKLLREDENGNRLLKVYPLSE